jgi:COX assembly mitochondrial protein 2
MHPPLDRPHPDCSNFIESLNKCHSENEYAKFWGACNDAKAAMDICFREEKERVRRENNAKARQMERTGNKVGGSYFSAASASAAAAALKKENKSV